MFKKPPEIGGLTHKIRKTVFSYFRCPVFAFSVSRYTDIGLELSITGGITPADLPLFRDINVKAFIAGRALAGAAHPAQVAAEFHAQIDAIWG